VHSILDRRRAAQLAAVTLGLAVLAMCVATVWLDWLTHYPGTGGPLVDSLAVGAAGIPAASVATLLAARRPGNPIGWLLFGVLFTGASPSNQYIILAYRLHPGTMPFGWVAVVLQQTWPMFLVLVAVMLWLFPDGKLPRGRWRRPSEVLLITGVTLGAAASTSG
jgi:hypothetical protein